MEPLSLEEFGVDLFEAIKAKSGALQAEKHANAYRKRGLLTLAEEATHQAERLNHTLLTIFQRNMISAVDLKRIQAMR